MVSDVFNMDCVEYMRTLPDNHFDIAICDPPYGDADIGNFHLGGAVWRTVRPLQAATNYPPNHSKNRLESTHKAELGRQSTEKPSITPTALDSNAIRGGYKLTASYNALTGMLPHHKSSLMSFSA